MRDRVALRAVHDDEGTIRGTARASKASRNAVRRALAPGARDRYYRPSALESAEPAVRDVLADYPHMAVADIAVLVEWKLSRRQLSDLVARLRPDYVTRDSATATPVSEITAPKLDPAPIRELGELTTGEVAL